MCRLLNILWWLSGPGGFFPGRKIHLRSGMFLYPFTFSAIGFSRSSRCVEVSNFHMFDYVASLGETRIFALENRSLRGEGSVDLSNWKEHYAFPAVFADVISNLKYFTTLDSLFTFS